MDKTIIIGTNESIDEVKKLIKTNFPKESKQILVVNCVDQILTSVHRSNNRVVILLGDICLGSVFAVITKIKDKEKKSSIDIYQYTEKPVEDWKNRFTGIVEKTPAALISFLRTMTQN